MTVVKELHVPGEYFAGHNNPPPKPHLTPFHFWQSGGTVLAVAEDPGAYRPKTEVTRQAYEQLLHMLSSFMGEQPADILRGAADEILAVIKDDALQVRAREEGGGGGGRAGVAGVHLYSCAIPIPQKADGCGVVPGGASSCGAVGTARGARVMERQIAWEANPRTSI